MKIRSESIGGGTETTLFSEPAFVHSIAVDDASVYWTASDGTIMKVALAGGTPTTLATGQDKPQGIAVDATSVYWANAGGISGQMGTGIMKIAK